MPSARRPASSQAASVVGITFVADPSGVATATWGLGVDYSRTSLYQRSRRFSLVADDGNVVAFNMVKDAAQGAEVLLGQAAAVAA